jgi:aspartate/tyrosine/aromatic aminotransferase
LFETLQALPADTILGLIAEYRDDPRPNKIDLGVGVYRNAAGETPVLATIKKAEQRLLQTQTSKSYLGTAGDAAYNTAMQAMIFAGSAADDRLVTLQTPGGSGSLRVAAGLLMRAREDATVWVSEPTWANHVPLLGGAGLTLKAYPYYDTDKHVIHIDEMLETLRAAPKGDVVLLHACCHNPCGLDPSENEWREIAAVVAERELLPFIDIAYQGFASNIDDDAFAVRHMASVLPEMIVSSSCSKNFGLYRDRVGSLSLLSSTADSLAALASQANNYVRTVYSVPPDHGAAVVSIILNDDDLHTEWLAELKDMRDRLIEMRMLLNDALIEKIQDHDFSHLKCAKGMFCFLGISAEQIARLKQDFGIYMVDTSRINVAGITVDNVDYLADSIAAVL